MNDNADETFSEKSRQAVLASYPVDGDELKAQLDRLADLAARVCNAPVGLVSLVEAERQFFAGRSGTALTETPRSWSFCAHAMLQPGLMEVPDATRDDRFHENPLVTDDPAIRFYAGQPLKSPEGMPLGSLCVIDTEARAGLDHDQRETLRTLAIAAMAILERWRVEHRSHQAEERSQSEIHELEQRFRTLADAMPQLVWSTAANGLADYFSHGWCDFTGQPSSVSEGLGWLRFLHPDDLDPTGNCWNNAVAEGSDYEIEYRLQRHDGEYRWMLTRGLPIRNRRGTIVRWIGTCTDIHEQRTAAERQEVLSRELSHRIKNIFAVIGGLISITLRNNPEMGGLGKELQDRVLALGRAHDFVRPHSAMSRPHYKRSSLKGMLNSLLEPYQMTGEGRILIVGEDAEIDDRSATPLALFFHELATNSVKYGALSGGGGSVEITIDGNDAISLSWAERGGPPVHAPTENGFGTSLIELSIGRQLGGTLRYDWRREGLHVTARIPTESMTREAGFV